MMADIYSTIYPAYALSAYSVFFFCDLADYVHTRHSPLHVHIQPDGASYVEWIAEDTDGHASSSTLNIS